MLTRRLSRRRRGKGRLLLSVNHWLFPRSQQWKVSDPSSALYYTDSDVLVFVKIPTAKCPPTPAASVVSVAQTMSAGQPTESDLADTPRINILIHAVGCVFARVDQMERTFATHLDRIETLLQSVNNSSVLNNPPDLSGIWNMYRNPNMVGSHQGTGMTQCPPALLQDRGYGFGDTTHSNHLPGPSFNAHMDVPMAPPGDMQATWLGMFNTLDDPQHPAGKNSLPYIFVSVLMICIR